jgi:NADH:ubiquinone oxidoreductase subunit 4 (subunit M)
VVVYFWRFLLDFISALMLITLIILFARIGGVYFCMLLSLLMVSGLLSSFYWPVLMRVNLFSVSSLGLFSRFLRRFPYVLSAFLAWYFITILFCPYFDNFYPLSWASLSFYEPVSLLLCILTTLLTPICIFIGRHYKNSVLYSWLFLLMELLLVICFLTHNLLVFFISFELVTALMFLVILYWGYEPRRSLASFYFFYFTFFSSLFFLLGLGALFYTCGSLSWYDLTAAGTPSYIQTFV